VRIHVVITCRGAGAEGFAFGGRRQACRHPSAPPSGGGCVAPSALRLHLLPLRLSRDEEMRLRGAADRSRSKRPCDAKLSLSCREGLPNLAFNPFASTLPLFAASLRLSPQEPNSRSTFAAVANITTNIVRCAFRHCICALPRRTPVSSVVRARASVGRNGISLWLGRSSLCGDAEPRIGPGSFI
jgi:hypothetical protein